nr:hypothetical protein [Halovulum marinum]
MAASSVALGTSRDDALQLLLGLKLAREIEVLPEFILRERLVLPDDRAVDGAVAFDQFRKPVLADRGLLPALEMSSPVTMASRR